MTNIVPRIGNSAGNGPASPQLSNNDNAKTRFTDILASGENYQVSRLNIPAHCNLPLQSNHQTSRHITVLSGIVHVTLADDVFVLVSDESIYIPHGSLHGLENRANDTSVIVSVDYTA